MDDEIWTRDEPDSPCQRVCVVHPQAKLCIGCHRTIEEISRWSRMTPDERRAIMAELPGREGQLRGTRRGRSRNR